MRRMAASSATGGRVYLRAGTEDYRWTVWFGWRMGLSTDLAGTSGHQLDDELDSRLDFELAPNRR